MRCPYTVILIQQIQNERPEPIMDHDVCGTARRVMHQD